MARRFARALALTLVVVSTSVVAVTAVAAPPGDDEVVAFEVRGVGNGHGRGMSQWGAYGRALAGHDWEDILAAYYGGTKPGTRAEDHLRIRLTGWDGAGQVGVISASGKAYWSGAAGSYTSLYARETTSNVFEVWGSVAGRGCAPDEVLTVPGPGLVRGMPAPDPRVADLQQLLNSAGFNFDAGPVDGDFGQMTEAAVIRFQLAEGLPTDGQWQAAEVAAAQQRLGDVAGNVTWVELADAVAGPITFTTTVSQTAAAPGDVLGLCRSSGTVSHYRGALEFHHTGDGNRVVNDLDVENYLRGVLPKEVSPSWGAAGGGAGMNSLRAQSVAARSYGLSQNRYSYASTCDTSSCQVYGGAATRSSATTNNYLRAEHANTDAAIGDTAGVVREWSDGGLVSTEFSASNGPRTAGGAFPSVDDPYDDVPGNPNHRWTRVIDADAIMSKYGLSSANGVATAVDPDSAYDGIWANEVRLGNGTTISAWDFRNAFGLRAPGFELVPIRRTVTNAVDLAFIGDSVGVSVADGASSEFRVVTEGAFADELFDSRVNRRTQGGTVTDGVSVAATVPIGTDIAVVELGYNDDPAQMSTRIDAMMSALRSRKVGLVLWVNVSERRTTTSYATTNAALAAAASTWDEMVVLDWNGASDQTGADRWFDDGVHLSATGQAEFSLWLREQLLGIVADGYTPPRPVVPGKPLRVSVMGRGGIPAIGAGTDVVGVALNVTAVGPVGPGFLRVWPCGSAEPETSSVNFVAAGAVEPNAVVVPVDDTGEVCVSSLVASDVIVDVSGWFESGLRGATGRLVDTREGSERVVPGEVLRVPVTDRVGVPDVGVVGVALNVTAVGPVGPGFLRVWPCGSAEPETSSVNFVAAGAVEPNAVVVPVDDTGEVCASSLVTTDVIVDLTAWFDDGLRASPGERIVDTRYGVGPIPAR